MRKKDEWMNCKKCGSLITPLGSQSKNGLCMRCSGAFKFEKQIKDLIGSKVMKIEKTDSGVNRFTFQDCFIIHFDNGLKLSAMDGEYADNAFCFIPKTEYEKMKKEGWILKKIF